MTSLWTTTARSPWGDEAPTHALMGRFGNVMLVNGITDHALDVAPGEVVRFFLTNVANTRTYKRHVWKRAREARCF